MKAIRKEQAAVIVVIAIQLIFMVYWGTQKSGYYVDEFFTYDNAHYLSASTPKRIKLYDADFLTYDEWHEISELKSTLTVTREEALLHDPAGYNLKVWFTRYPYMVLFHYVQALFFEGELSKWSAIALNIVLFLLNQILLYRLAHGISGDRTAAVLAVALYGFTGMAASMTVYVRFYMLVTLWMTLYTCLHVRMWEEDNMVKNLLMEFLSVVILYQAYRDSPLAAIQGVGMVCAFLAGLLIRKRYRQAAAYGIPIVGGGLAYVLLKTDYAGYILHPEKFADADVTNVATAGLLGNFLTLTPGAFVQRMTELSHVVCRYLFGHALVLGAYLLLAAVLLVWLACTKKRRTGELDGRFFLIAVCPCAFYCVVSVCLDLGAIRYNSSIFPELAVCAAVFVMLLARRLDSRRLAAVGMGIVILAAAIATAVIPRVDNLYREDRDAVEQIRSYQGTDSVVVDCHFDDRIMYECLVYADEDTQVMFTSRENVDYDAWHSDVLLWFRVDEGRDIIEELASSGRYTVLEVGRTHESDVYFVSRHDLGE